MTLNQILETAGESGINFEVTSIGSERDFPKKDGGTYKSCSVELKIPSTGQVEDARLFKSQIEQWGMKVGCTLNGKAGKYAGSKYAVWTPVRTGEEVLNETPQNNYQQVKAERAVSEAMTEERRKDQVKQAMISLAGLMQAHISAGMDNKGALEAAQEARKMLLEAAVEEVTPSM